MGIFERLNNLKDLLNIMHDIWHRCLSDLPDRNEQRDIEEGLESIEKGMIRLQKISTQDR
jgi:hypothetical protein